MNNLENLPANLGNLLLVCVALYVAWRFVIHHCEAAPFMEEQPQAFTPDPVHIKGILSEIEALRQPLPQFAKRDAGNTYDYQQDAADLARGTSDNVLAALQK